MDLVASGLHGPAWFSPNLFLKVLPAVVR